MGDYVASKLALPGDQRNELRKQIGRLLEKLEAKVNKDGPYRIKKFRRAGSLEKGTSNRPRAGKPVDGDVGVYFEVDDPENFDVADLQKLIKQLLEAAYPQKSPDDFDDSGDRIFEVVFKGTGLEVDLVPIVSLDDDANYGYQYSRTGDRVKTSVKVHLEHFRSHSAKDVFLAPTLRMAKRWRHWQELAGVQSFHLELLCSYLIDRDGAASGLEEGLRRLLLFIVRDLTNGVTWGEGDLEAFDDPVVILDPANAENNVAARITRRELDALVAAARTGYETLTFAQGLQFKGETEKLWKELFGPGFAIE
ncbi:MAG TPA: CBASS oligonucleotide cyclase [Solirubrobacteraceae bacterium]|nr:CBASS oligonucleotide cyclase [Solirubrobacteraceae bacterium]